MSPTTASTPSAMRSRRSLSLPLLRLVFSADERRVQQFSPVRTAGRSCFVVTPNDVDMVSGALDVVKTHKVPGDAATDLYSYIREKRIFPSQYTDEAGATRWRPCEVELPIRDLCTILSVRPWTALASP